MLCIEAMGAAHPVFYSFAEYVQLEELSSVKHEFLGGRIYAMAGRTPEHAALTMAVGIALGAALEGSRCRAYSSDLMIRVPATGLGTYPDVTVVCGPRETDPESKNAVTNPALLVEVTSKSTEEYDKGEKFDHYKQIASLREYILELELVSVPSTLDVTAIYRAASDPRE
jgi:Uma2 family endonuclease